LIGFLIALAAGHAELDAAMALCGEIAMRTGHECLLKAENCERNARACVAASDREKMLVTVSIGRLPSQLICGVHAQRL
jgi:hypothetical protein